jgi:hypothetical protein
MTRTISFITRCRSARRPSSSSSPVSKNLPFPSSGTNVQIYPAIVILTLSEAEGEESLYFARSTVDATGKIQGSVRSSQPVRNGPAFLCPLTSRRGVISTGAGQLYRPAQWRNPQILGCLHSHSASSEASHLNRHRKCGGSSASLGMTQFMSVFVQVYPEIVILNAVKNPCIFPEAP